MARGWESKDVEAQVEASDAAKAGESGKEQNPQKAIHAQQLRDLQLSRTRIVNDLNNATNPNYRKTLEAALAHLDQKIAELK